MSSGGGAFGDESPDYYKPGWYHPPASAVPTWEVTFERHPDKRPSSSQAAYESRDKDFYVILGVRGSGVILVRCEGHPETGKLMPMGLACFSDEMMLFGLEAEAGAPC